MIYTNYILLTR